MDQHDGAMKAALFLGGTRSPDTFVLSGTGHRSRDQIRLQHLEMILQLLVHSVDRCCETVGRHLRSDFCLTKFLPELKNAFVGVVFAYVVFDYLNSPSVWIEANWNKGLVDNVVLLAQNGLLTNDAIVDIPYTKETSKWITTNTNVS